MPACQSVAAEGQASWEWRHAEAFPLGSLVGEDWFEAGYVDWCEQTMEDVTWLAVEPH